MTFSAMTLSTWLGLFGGFGGAIVLLYLLRLRRRRIEVPFGALWQRVVTEKQTTSLFKVLKNVLSLLIQLVILALVLTAIADPRWTGDSQVAEASERKIEPAHTLLVVDTSGSMATLDGTGGGDRMSEARTAARRVVDGMRPGEVLMLVRMDREATVLTDWSKDREALRTAIDGLVARDATTSLTAALDFADSAVRGLDNPQVILVTDRNVDPPDGKRIMELGIRVLPVGPDKAAPNLAILDFSVRSHLGNQLRYALHYTLLNASQSRVAVEVNLYADSSGKAQSAVDFRKLPPARAPFRHVLEAGEERAFDQLDIDLEGSRAALFVRAAAEAGGDAASVVQAFGDRFEADDAAFAIVPERRTVKVQLVGPENLFLMAALSTRRSVEVEHKALTAYQGTDGYDLTLFNAVVPPSLPRGNVAFVNVPSPTVAPGPTTASPLPFGVGKPVESPGDLLVPSSAKDHPAMAFVKFVDLEVPRLQPLERRRGQEVLARTKAGAVAILAGSSAERRYVGIGFDPVESEWVGHYSFSIFFVNVVNWLFREESAYLRSETLAAEWQVQLPWADAKKVAVTRPGGGTATALVDGAGGLIYTGDQAGIYEVRLEGAPAEQPPVLVPATLGSREESKLVPRGDYTTWVPAMPEDGALPEITFAGLSLWRLLALIAAGLLLLEWFTFHRRWTV